MSATSVNLLRGRPSSLPRAISAASMARQPAESTASGWRARTSSASASRLGHRVGQLAGVEIGHQAVNGLQGTGLVRADEPGRPALDPARDVRPGHRCPGVGIDDTTTVVGNHSRRLVERKIANRLAAVANGRQHQARVQLAQLVGAGDRELHAGGALLAQNTIRGELIGQPDSRAPAFGPASRRRRACSGSPACASGQRRP